MAFIDKDFELLYESSCYALRNSIINALVEVLSIFNTDKILLDEEDSIEVNGCKVCGIQIKDGFLYIIIKNEKGKFGDYKICDKQRNKTFKAFNADIHNWINFINTFKRMIFALKE